MALLAFQIHDLIAFDLLSQEKLEAIKSSLKKVPHAPNSRFSVAEDSESDAPKTKSKSSTPKSSPPMPKVIGLY